MSQQAFFSTIAVDSQKTGARGGARTHDPGFKSPMLYRLSYPTELPGLYGALKSVKDITGPWTITIHKADHCQGGKLQVFD